MHSGHIVKVDRVAPEMSADAMLNDSAARAYPKPASCHAETQSLQARASCVEHSLISLRESRRERVGSGGRVGGRPDRR